MICTYIQIGPLLHNNYVTCSTRYCRLSYFVISGHPNIWIMGDSIVRRAKERAAATRQLQLGTPYTIQWHGQGGARLKDVERMVNNGLRYSAPPSIVVLHLGTNNIGQMDACSCRAAIRTALSTLRARMPQALIMWSSILPRLVYHGKRPTGHTNQDALEGVRISLNNYARRQTKRMGNASIIMHNIARSNHQMFIRDGVHLSDQGSDILIADLALAIKKALFQ
ncbi:uncharacterized protein [Diadema antillarum]|uniref:uncharacterized protein n=1 Tax=Diadema antillarum TaxID=105358 RepID=UPI003A8958A8